MGRDRGNCAQLHHWRSRPCDRVPCMGQTRRPHRPPLAAICGGPRVPCRDARSSTDPLRHLVRQLQAASPPVARGVGTLGVAAASATN